ncbi:MAG: NAD-binding protein, partial [Acidobacteriota bacterium]
PHALVAWLRVLKQRATWSHLSSRTFSAMARLFHATIPLGTCGKIGRVKPSRRRLLTLLGLLPVLLVMTALAYMQVMQIFEHEPRNFLDAIEWASETITTTGYGRDAEWDHPITILFVIVMQFLGVFLVYMLVPLFLLPMLEERFEARLPREAPGDLDDHVVIFRWGPAVETLLDELLTAEIPVLIADLDEAACRGVLGRSGSGKARAHVVHAASVTEALRATRLDHARALVTNGSDEEDTIVVLIARELGFEGEVLALVEEPYHGKALASAGATAVFTPRHVLGAALAARASPRIQPRVDGVQQFGPNLRVAEVRIDPGSELAGQTLAEADLGQRTGAHVIGQWVRGRLDSRVQPELVIEPGGILLSIGRPESLDELVGLATDGRQRRAAGPFIVAGYGEVGRKIADLLRAVGEQVLVVDKFDSADEIDVRGDIVDPLTLERLDLDRARALLLALDSDSSTLFATLILKDEAPGLPIYARANAAESLDRLYRAGADYAVSISQVSAQILVHRLLDRSSLSLDTELQIVSTGARELADRRLAALDIRERLGCSVVAVERGDEVLTELDPDFRFEPDDLVYVCGHRSGTERFVWELGT